MKKHSVDSIQYTVAISIILVIFLVALVLTNDSFQSNFSTGLTILPIEQSQQIQINQNFSQNSTINITKQQVTSIKITGAYTGNEPIKILAITDRGNLTILEKTQTQNQTSTNLITGFVTKENENNKNKQTEINIPLPNTPIVNPENPENSTINTTTSNTTINETVNQTNTGTNTSTNETNTTKNETTNNQLNNTPNLTNATTNTTTNVTTNETINKTNTTLQINNETQTTYTFEQECQETCSLQSLNLQNIQIMITQGTLQLETIHLTTTTNQTIQQIKNIENQEIITNQQITLNLSEYFQGQNIFYDLQSSPGYNYTFESLELNNPNPEILVITPLKTGIWPTKIYANSQQTTLTSNEFNVTIIEASEKKDNKTQKPDNKTQPITPTTPTTPNTEKIPQKILQKLQEKG
ncbi:hypothetical protein K9L97_03370, partial [Candidatus Woesearchaeota archaeon]|nr:hypothetical protein [Candidatus Woesearchaeota archaeon]